MIIYYTKQRQTPSWDKMYIFLCCIISTKSTVTSFYLSLILLWLMNNPNDEKYNLSVSSIKCKTYIVVLYVCQTYVETRNSYNVYC